MYGRVFENYKNGFNNKLCQKRSEVPDWLHWIYLQGMAQLECFNCVDDYWAAGGLLFTISFAHNGNETDDLKLIEGQIVRALRK